MNCLGVVSMGRFGSRHTSGGGGMIWIEIGKLSYEAHFLNNPSVAVLEIKAAIFVSGI